MPRAEAGISGGLPLFECSSFGLAPSKTCLQKQELNNFLVFHLLAAAIPSGLCSIMQNWSIMCFNLCTFDAHFCSVLTGQNWQPCQWGEGALYVEFQFPRHDCKLSFRFASLPECPGRVCSQATEWNTVKSSLFLLWLRIPLISSPHMTF